MGSIPTQARDPETEQWLSDLLGAPGRSRDEALANLRNLLLRVARREATRRSESGITGQELDDLAQQAASDAMLAILAKLSTFRGESRFTTWAYRFAVFEVSAKLGRHYWSTHRALALEDERWERFPDRFGVAPEHHAEGVELIAAVRSAVDTSLTARERELFIAVVVNAVPLDAVVATYETTRNAVYKAIFDGRRKIRAHLVANGYLADDRGLARQEGSQR